MRIGSEFTLPRDGDCDQSTNPDNLNWALASDVSELLHINQCFIYEALASGGLVSVSYARNPDTTMLHIKIGNVDMTRLPLTANKQGTSRWGLSDALEYKIRYYEGGVKEFDLGSVKSLGKIDINVSPATALTAQDIKGADFTSELVDPNLEWRATTTQSGLKAITQKLGAHCMYDLVEMPRMILGLK